MVGTSPIGARYPIEHSPNTHAPGQISTLLENQDDPEADKNGADYNDVPGDPTSFLGAKTGKLGSRHPIITPYTRVTNHSLWPEQLTGLVGW